METGKTQPVANNRPNFLTARKNGFLFDNNGMQGVSITPEQSDVTIALVPEARIVGHVNLAGSGEASGMRVQLYRRQVLQGRAHWDPMGNAEVRSDGEFRFADLSAGSYKVFTEESLDRDPVTSNRRAQVFGYPPVYFPAAADFVGAAVIQLSAGETFQASLAPVKREYYPVKIGVTNGAVGVQLEVEVWRQGHEGPGYALGYNFRDGTIGQIPAKRQLHGAGRQPWVELVDGNCEYFGERWAAVRGDDDTGSERGDHSASDGTVSAPGAKGDVVILD